MCVPFGEPYTVLEGSMTDRRRVREKVEGEMPIGMLEVLPLWQLDIEELTGHNLETRGREEVNRLLQTGWRLLHIYTLKYQEDGVWRERPMAILGKPRASTDQRSEGPPTLLSFAQS